MAEWLKAHDSKSCGPKGLGGSNPLASAINFGTKKTLWSLFLFKLKLKKEDSLSSASSSQKCKHFFELLLEGESNIFYSLPLPVKTAATVFMRILIS